MSADELMTDAELDAWLKKANDDLLASLNRHIDVDAWLREVLRRGDEPAPRRPRRTRVRLLVRAWCRKALPSSRLARFRAWFVVFAALTLYLVWVIGVEYRVRSGEPGFVLPNLAVLLVWWGVFTRTWVAGTRLPGGAQ